VASQILIDILGYGHVLSAIGWLGGGILTTFVLGPNVRKLTPGASLEFNAKVLPRIVRFVEMMIVSTFGFGLLLLYFIQDGDFSWLSSTTQGYEISTGIVLALTTAAVVFSVTVPSFRKVSKLAESILHGEQKSPPPEMMKYGKRARTGSLVAITLLLLVLSMMVASGFS
jgi:uncharacterized membrane protein